MKVDLGKQLPLGGVCWALYELGRLVIVVVGIARCWI